MKKITVLTAITRNKDNLRDTFPKSKAKFVAYLDKETKEETFTDLWKIKNAYNLFKEPRRNAKIHKILPHLFIDTDISIWLDGNISLNITPEELAEKWLVNKDIAVWKHFERTCLYDEADCLLKMNVDKNSLIEEQVEKYKKENYPKQCGFGECNVIVRRHTDKIARLNEKWWIEICRYSSRDQISFNYIFRDNVELINGNPREHPDFNYNYHNFVETDYAAENNL